MTTRRKKPEDLRSRLWFDDPSHPDSVAIHLERYLNYGLTREELQGGRPIIAIAQTGSDLSPCNRHHIELAKRVRDGIRDAGGVPFEVPVHPIQETGKRPTAMLDRNLAYLGLVEALHGYPFDGVVLTIGCDKTTPACLMAAATVDIPAIALSGGPMLDAWWEGKLAGSGMVKWEARKKLATGELDYAGFIDLACRAAPSPGHCNTMGTALTMNSLTEALGMSLPGCASIPAPYAGRAAMAYVTGKRIVEMVWEDLKPSDILTRGAFLNAIRVNTLIGGSTNAPIHLQAIARHVGAELSLEDWQEAGYALPLLVDCQPSGRYLGEAYNRAGGVPVVAKVLADRGLLDPATTVTGRTLAENVADAPLPDGDVIRPFDRPLKDHAGFLVLSGNLFDAAIMKTSVISQAFRKAWLEVPGRENVMEGTAVVFDGAEDYRARINDPDLPCDANSILVVRGAGPIGHPGAAEVVNMQPPDRLIREGIRELPTLGDGRQSGTSNAPSILNASPEAAAGGGLARLKTGDRLVIDLNARTANAIVPQEEWEARAATMAVPESQTPWQALYREKVGPLNTGMCFDFAVAFRKVRTHEPRNSH